MFKFFLSIVCIFSTLVYTDNLSIDNATPIIHLEGSAYERGYTHGKMLQEKIRKNIHDFIDSKSASSHFDQEKFATRSMKLVLSLPRLRAHIPQKFFDEMRGVADGADVAYEKIEMLNLFPEMFHCIGITASGSMTCDGSVYHARVLDYNAGKGLEKTAAIFIVNPDEGHRYVNISYAGFIGSISGMNIQQISIGEVGGDGYGDLDGMPMAFIIRELLENAATLQEAKALLEKCPRTCEYYYIISDGKDNTSVAAFTNAMHVDWINPGTTYSIYNPCRSLQDRDKGVFVNLLETSSKYQTTIQDCNGLNAIIHKQPGETIVITGFSNPNRYPVAINRILAEAGKIDETSLMEIVKSPVARPSNLHNVIFHPSTLDFYISHRNENTLACDNSYRAYNLEVLAKQ